MEEWRDIDGYERLYQVSDLGNVKSLERTTVRRGHIHKVHGKILKQSRRRKENNDYKTVTLSKEGKVKTFLVHQLVAMAFLNHTPNGFNKVIDHKNDIKNDNRAENLQIVTHRKNLTKKKLRGNTNSVGVHWAKERKRFIATIQKNGKQVNLGSFKTELEAKNAYQEAVSEIITNQ